MLRAINIETGEKSLPDKNIMGICPLCKEKVIARCGSINEHHWAHEKGFDCDEWGEETDWHRGYKKLVLPDYTEVIMTHYETQEGENNLIKHRADIRNINNTVIELQSKYLSPEERNEREEFYHNMVWLINGEHFDFYNLNAEQQVIICNKYNKDFGSLKKSIYYYLWSHPAKWLVKPDLDFQSGRYVYLDVSRNSNLNVICKILDNEFLDNEIWLIIEIHKWKIKRGKKFITYEEGESPKGRFVIGVVKFTKEEFVKLYMHDILIEEVYNLHKCEQPSIAIV